MYDLLLWIVPVLEKFPFMHTLNLIKYFQKFSCQVITLRTSAFSAPSAFKPHSLNPGPILVRIITFSKHNMPRDCMII